jgi:PKD repeat protein
MTTYIEISEVPIIPLSAIPDNYLTSGNVSGISSEQPYVWFLSAGSPSVLSIFFADKTTGTSATSFIFTSLSIGNISTYIWDFGEGSSASSISESGPINVSYSTSGYKTVSLIVSGIDGSNIKTIQNYIFIESDYIPPPPLLIEDQIGLAMYIYAWYDSNGNEVFDPEERAALGNLIFSAWAELFMNNNGETISINDIFETAKQICNPFAVVGMSITVNGVHSSWYIYGTGSWPPPDISFESGHCGRFDASNSFITKFS